MSWLLRQCPKCNGDMYREDKGWHCLQCGIILVEKNRPVVVDYTASQGYTHSNRRPLRTRQGVGV